MSPKLTQFVTLPELPPDEAKRIRDIGVLCFHKITKLKVRVGDDVKMRDVLCEYQIILANEAESVVWRGKVFSQRIGRVSNTQVRDGERVSKGQCLLCVEYCSHDTLTTAGMCIHCGANIGDIEKERAKFAKPSEMSSLSAVLGVAKEQALFGVPNFSASIGRQQLARGRSHASASAKQRGASRCQPLASKSKAGGQRPHKQLRPAGRRLGRRRALQRLGRGSALSLSQGSRIAAAVAKERQMAPLIMSSSVTSHKQTLHLSATAMHRTKRENTQHLISQRKLALVLDIDHTFLHASRDAQGVQVANHPLLGRSVFKFELADGGEPYYIKLRPGFAEFINAVKDQFEIHLYTMSVRRYAQEIVKHIEEQVFIQSESESESTSDGCLPRTSTTAPMDSISSTKQIASTKMSLIKSDSQMAAESSVTTMVPVPSNTTTAEVKKTLKLPSSKGSRLKSTITTMSKASSVSSGKAMIAAKTTAKASSFSSAVSKSSGLMKKSKKRKSAGLIKNLVTRDDVPESSSKYLDRLFPCDKRVVVIIDDRVDVWPNAVESVIQIQKYLFWPSTDEEFKKVPTPANNRGAEQRLDISRLCVGATVIRLRHRRKEEEVTADLSAAEKKKSIRSSFEGKEKEAVVFPPQMDAELSAVTTADASIKSGSSALRKVTDDRITVNEEEEIEEEEKAAETGGNGVVGDKHTTADGSERLDDETLVEIREMAEELLEETQEEENECAEIAIGCAKDKLSSAECKSAKESKSKTKSEQPKVYQMTSLDRSMQKHLFAEFRRFGVQRIGFAADFIEILTYKSPPADFLKFMSNSWIPYNTAKYPFLKEASVEFRMNFEELKRRDSDRVLLCLSQVLNNVADSFDFENFDTDSGLSGFDEDEMDASPKTGRAVSPGTVLTDAAGISVKPTAFAVPFAERSSLDCCDCRQLLAAERRKVFDGCVFAFSGIWARDCPVAKRELWQLATQYGAKCVDELSADNCEAVTHCVCNRMGSVKTHNALVSGVQLVHCKWIHNSVVHFQRSREALYRPNLYKQESDKQTTAGKPEHSGDGSEDQSSVSAEKCSVKDSTEGKKKKDAKSAKNSSSAAKKRKLAETSDVLQQPSDKQSDAGFKFMSLLNSGAPAKKRKLADGSSDCEPLANASSRQSGDRTDAGLQATDEWMDSIDAELDSLSDF